MYKFQYAIFYSIALFLMLFPKKVRRWIFVDGLGRLLFLLASRPKKIINVNLDLAFQNRLSKKEKREIALACIKNLISEVLSVIENYFTPIETLNQSVYVKGLDVVEKIKKEGRSIIFTTFHYDNLELAGLALGTVSKTVHIVQEANNPYIDRFTAVSREKNGIKTVPMKKAVRHMAAQMKKGGDISIVVDQSVGNDAGIFVQFFGQETIHLTTASYLARKFNAALVPTVLEWIEGKPTLVFYDPVAFTKSDNEEADILRLTQAQASFLEALIKRDPKPWFWCHKRWKYNKEEIYKNL